MIYPAGGVVNPFITGMPPPIFEQVFNGRHTEDEEDGDHGDLLAESVYGREPVK